MKSFAYGFAATAAVALAATGVMAALALSAGTQQEPNKTVTINVATGPAGATGPQGPPGTVECNTGYTFGNLVINHPGGQVTIQTCIKD